MTLRCLWCMKDVPSSPCPHCGTAAVDKDAPHEHHWSRLTMDSVQCKQCEKVITMEEYYKFHERN